MPLAPRFPIEKCIAPEDLDGLDPAEKDAVLEAAYLAVAADHRLAEEEADAFGRVAGLLGGTDPLEGGALDAVLDAHAVRLDREGVETRLGAVAAALGRPDARDVAFRVAHAMAMCDLASHDREFEFELDLAAALGLSQDAADALAARVDEALAADDDESPYRG